MIFRRRNREDSHDRAKRPFWLLVPFLLTIWLLSIVPGLQPAQPVTADNGTTITLESAVTEINGCETLDLYIRINDVPVEANLYGADVRLAFDPTVLEVVALEELDDLLKPDWIVRKEFDNDAGTVWLAWTQKNPTPPASGSGYFARVTFLARGTQVSSPVTFSYTKLANTNGFEIPATAVNGSLTTIAPAAPAVGIEILNPTTPRLSWTAVSGVDGYNIYRDTYAYFTPDLPYDTVTTPEYDDDDALGDIADNYFYVIRSACVNGFESDISNRVGEFDYPLATVINSNLFNMIGLPLDSTASIVPFQASGLISYVGDGIEQVLKWDSALQGYEGYDIFSPGFLNFPLTIGQAYLLETDSEVSTVLTLVGNVPAQGSVTFDFIIGSASACAFNSLTIPLDRTDIALASDLMANITGVDQVLTWNVFLQGYDSYDGSGPSFLNFPVRAGHPYLVCLNNMAPASWP